MKNATSFFFLLMPFFLRAQTGNDIKITTDNKGKNVDVDFFSSRVIFNLLVHMNDSSGKTVFLDMQNNFSGYYKKMIDLKNEAADVYYLEIIKDKEHINRKIVLK